jgi:hypothetical protein
MSLYQSFWAKNQRNTPTGDCRADQVAQIFEFPLTATALQAGDIVELGVLPANHSITDAILLCDDLDSNATPTIKLDAGIMSGSVGAATNADGSARTCGTELFAADVSAQTGVISRMSQLSGFTLNSSDTDRSIGVKINTAAATQGAAGQKIRMLVTFRPVQSGSYI